MSTRRIQTAVPRMYGDHSARPLIRRYLAAPLSVRGRHWHRQSQCAAERCLYGRLPQIPRAVAIPEFTFLLMGLGCQSAHRLWRLVDLACLWCLHVWSGRDGVTWRRPRWAPWGTPAVTDTAVGVTCSGLARVKIYQWVSAKKAKLYA